MKQIIRRAAVGLLAAAALAIPAASAMTPVTSAAAAYAHTHHGFGPDSFRLG